MGFLGCVCCCGSKKSTKASGFVENRKREEDAANAASSFAFILCYPAITTAPSIPVEVTVS